MTAIINKIIELLKSLLPEQPVETKPIGTIQERFINEVQSADYIPEALKPVVVAQALLESGRFTSGLATDHNNFHGLKMRPELSEIAIGVSYGAHDGVDQYAQFRSVEEEPMGYMTFINRSVYNGWQAYETDPIGYIAFIKGKGYATDPDYVSKVVALLDESRALLRMDPIDDSHEIITGQKLLWYPKAEKNVGGAMRTRGKYAKKYPVGAVVHYTAGRCETEQDAINTLKGGIKGKLCYFMIGPKGKVYQNFPLDEHGYHAGSSAWPGIGGTVSNDLVGIEIACAGKTDSKGKAHFGHTYDSKRIRTVHHRDHNIAPGTYVKFTSEQERALTELLVWLKKNNPQVFNVDFILGHDEVSGPAGIGTQRKVDPGASLSMNMGDFRVKIKSLV